MNRVTCSAPNPKTNYHCLEQLLGSVFSDILTQDTCTIVSADENAVAKDARWVVIKDKLSTGEAGITFSQTSDGLLSELEYFQNILDLASVLDRSAKFSRYEVRETFSKMSPLTEKKFFVYGTNRVVLATGAITDPGGIFSAENFDGEVPQEGLPLKPYRARFELILCPGEEVVLQKTAQVSRESAQYFLKVSEQVNYPALLQVSSERELIILTIMDRRGVMTAEQLKDSFRCSISLGDIEIPADSAADLRPGSVIEVDWSNNMEGVLKLEGEDWARVGLELSQKGYKIKILEF